MEIPTHYIEKYTSTQPPLFRSERDEQLSYFLNRGIKLKDRATGELRDMTDKELAIKLSHIPTHDLYAFRRQCEQARSFSRYFWWALKIKA